MPHLAGPTPGLSSLATRYGAILSDVWGVLHNGVTPHWDAVEALTQFRAGGGRVVLITNAPRPGTSIIAQLDAMDIPRDAYDALVSSGDATRSLLENWRGRTVARVGPAVDDVLFEGLDLTFGSDEEATAG